jgi:hypothetical protein
MNSDRAWNEMLDEFRALGGVAENVRLGQGSVGRGLFPIDPAKPMEIRIPESLLVSTADVVIENNVFRISPASPIGARERAFLEGYERDFAWGTGRIEIERFLAAMHELPERLRTMLIRDLGLGRYFNPVSIPLIQKWYFGTRDIICGNRRVVMPIIEMANHGGDVAYDTKSGVSLRGRFDGEVLVRYARPTDPYDMYLNWMFAPGEPIAFSIAMVVTRFRKPLEIGRDFDRESAPFVPEVAIRDDRLVAKYLLLGHQSCPHLPKDAFRRAMAQAGLDEPDEVYGFIQFENRRRFLDLLGALADVDLPAARALKVLALNQLNALSHHSGAGPM